MDTLEEAREQINIDNKYLATISVSLLRRLVNGDKVALKRVKDVLEGSDTYLYAKKEKDYKRLGLEFTHDKKKSLEYSKAEKILKIKMTTFYGLLQNKLDISKDDIKENEEDFKGDVNIKISTNIARGKKTNSDIEKALGEVRKVIGTSFKEGRGYWEVQYNDVSRGSSDEKNFDEILCIFHKKKYIIEVLLGKRFEQIKPTAFTYFDY